MNPAVAAVCVLHVILGRCASIREGLLEIEFENWRYFGVHSHNLGPIKKSHPRIVNLNIDEFDDVSG